MTNEVPDFEKIALEELPYIITLGRNKGGSQAIAYFKKIVEEKYNMGILAGRKAQVKVDLDIANTFNHGDHNGENFQKCCAADVAKAIESQVIE